MAEDFFLSHQQIEVPSLNSQDDYSCAQLPSPYIKFEEHQQPQLDQHFARCAAPSSSIISGSDQFLPTSSFLKPHMEWSGRQGVDHQFSPIKPYYDLTSTKNVASSHDRFNVAIDGHLPYGGLWSYSYNPRTTQSFHADSSAEFEFQIFPPREAYFNDILRVPTANYDFQRDPAELAKNISRSPTAESNCFTTSGSASECLPEVIECPISTTLAKSNKDDMERNTLAIEKRTSEEPYAKLIFRALLSTPSHSMVLQEIYQWFLENTNKGKSMSTGWRNSIRHNLSMNAAFCKTNRASNGDDSKKASVWVLDPFAIKNGVTPTTRYRKTGKKTVKAKTTSLGGVRADRKSGISSTKSKYLRQAPREVNGDLKRRSRREPSQNQQPKSTEVHCHRMSPSTPNDHESSDINQYYRPKDISFGGFLTLEDDHGLKIDENLVSYGGEYGIYPERHPYMWPSHHL